METIELSVYQLMWLTRNGGRKEKDVQSDGRGLYVLMFDPRAYGQVEKVYLPK